MREVVASLCTFTVLCAYLGAADYEYSLEMKESDGTVHYMGDVHIHVNEE
jgi:hypothetical protein